MLRLAPSWEKKQLTYFAIKLLGDALNYVPMFDPQNVCLWRRALVACLELKQVQPQTFVKRLGVEMVVSQGLYNRLQQEQFVTSFNKSKR